ncbi:APC family permease [Actinomycetaceae bacterium TAE3-ERU4]|nr:APC family permease [Actinomycetaceae bacterium TAE3-ERU4]
MSNPSSPKITKSIKSPVKGQVSLLGAISIGVGGMVGGGIFAVLGLAVTLAKGGTPIAFLMAGIIALLTARSYSVMSQNYPDRGGTVRFLNVAFGRGVFSGAIANLLWLSYIVMLSLYASAFGSYAPNLWNITGNTNIDFHIYATAVVVIATVVNYYSVKVVSRIESLAVMIKLFVLIGFVILGVYGLFSSAHLGQLSIDHWESPVHLFAGGMIIFVAYEGFELIANAAPDIVDPKRNIPRAYYICVSFVLALYVVIAIVTVGSLSFDEIGKAKDYVLAEAARPLLGQAGFTIMTIAALLSTFSAINASLLGGSRVSYEIAEDDELPHHFLYQLWKQPIGLFITAIATAVMVNTVKLESISTTGSVGFLLIFAIVNASSLRTRKQTHTGLILPLLGSVLCSIALIVLCNQQLHAAPFGLVIALIIIIFCFVGEYIYKRKSHPVK